MKANIILLLFGCFLGIAAAEVSSRYLLKPKEGTEFENIADFRKSLNDPRSKGHTRKSDGSLPFVAVVEPHPSDEIIYTLKANLDDRFTGVRVQTNSQGMRSPERPVEKKPGVYRLALLGDSFAFGWGVEQPQIFAQVIENRLNGSLPKERRAEVFNMGVPGYSTFQEAALFRERGLQFKPDGVLVFFIDNDFDFPFFIRDKASPIGLVESFSLGRIGAQVINPKLSQQRLAKAGLDPNTVLEKLGDELSQQSVPLFVAINPRKDWKLIQKRLPVLRARPNVHLLEIGNDFDSIVTKNGYTTNDLNLPKDPHPTPLRHSIYGELLAAELEPFTK